MDLRQELEITLKSVDDSLYKITRECKLFRTRPEDQKDSTGNLVMAPLLLARSNILLALSNIKE